MAVGDTVAAFASKANNATTDIQPGSGAEWLVHTLVVEPGKAAEVYLHNGSTFVLIDTITQTTHGLIFRLTNAHYMQLKNVSGGTASHGYEGVVKK